MSTSLNALLVTPGYQLAPNEPLSNSILNLIAKPTVQAYITEPIVPASYWRNGNFYSSLWTAFFFTGNTTSGSPTVSSVSSTTGLASGQAISGTGIPANTTISSVGSGTITLSANATANGTGVTFTPGVQCSTSTETTDAAFWTVNCAGAAVVCQPSTITPDLSSLYSLRITGNTSTTDVRLTQTLSADFGGVLRGGSISVSGWFYNATGGNITPVLEVNTANASNNFTSVTLQTSVFFTTCPVGQWTFLSASFSGNQTNAINGFKISIKIPNPALSSTSYYVLFDRWQLQPGTIVTSFIDDVSLFASLPTITSSNLGTGCVLTANIAANNVTYNCLDTTSVQYFMFSTGDVKDYAGVVLPAGWLTCDGTAISRTTYANLFNALTYQFTGNTTNGSPTISGSGVPSVTGLPFVSGPGIPAGATVISQGTNTLTLSANATATQTGASFVAGNWGIGDGLTTFNLPDLRGRVSVGTGGGVGLTNRWLGEYLGEEAHSLTLTELAGHYHSITDPGHVHGISDPGHVHTATDAGHQHAMFSPVQLGNVPITGGAGYCSNGASLTNTQTGYASISVASHTTGITVSSHTTGITQTNTTGSGTAHNTMQPTAVVHKIIKI